MIAAMDLDLKEIITLLTGAAVTIFGVIHKMDATKATKARRSIYLLVNSKMGLALRAKVNLCQANLTLAQRVAELTQAKADIAYVVTSSTALTEATVELNVHDAKQATVDALNDGKKDK